MKVKLLHSTPLWVCARAIRTCWDSHDKSDSLVNFTHSIDWCIENDTKFQDLTRVGEKDKELIERVGNKNKHSSTLEHLCGSAEIEKLPEDLYLALLADRFIEVTGTKDKCVISYNLRALQNLKVNSNFKMLLCPDEWKYLMEDLC